MMVKEDPRSLKFVPNVISGSERIINDYLKNEKPVWLPNCKRVNKHTRAGGDGKFIVCPQCDQGSYVYHFAWSALSCQHCDTMIDKYDWKLL